LNTRTFTTEEGNTLTFEPIQQLGACPSCNAPLYEGTYTLTREDGVEMSPATMHEGGSGTFIMVEGGETVFNIDEDGIAVREVAPSVPVPGGGLLGAIINAILASGRDAGMLMIDLKTGEINDLGGMEDSGYWGDWPFGDEDDDTVH